MLIEVKQLSTQYEAAYEQLLSHSRMAMFNHSLKYRKFLNRIIPGSKDYYLCAFCDGQLLATLPIFMKHGRFGTVVNSLPFYGSHGGIVSREDVSAEVVKTLFNALTKVCHDVDAITCTLIESPLDQRTDNYDYYYADVFDYRIGQISSLPASSDSIPIDDTLLAGYHQKTRNMVRKGMKCGFEVSHDSTQETFKALQSIHAINMQSIGGRAKPFSVFEAIKDVFVYDVDYRIYTARKDGQIVSALLVFFFKDMVEYFTPATLESYRTQQPLSLLIHSAMKDAVLEKNAKLWNWGGTWLSQDGVYQFKSRWGTVDYPYKYHVKLYKPDIITGQSKETFLSEYQNFYVIPFNAKVDSNNVE